MLLLHSLLFHLSSVTILHAAATNQHFLSTKSVEQDDCIRLIFTDFIRPTIGNSHAIQVNIGQNINAPLQSIILQMLHTTNCATEVISIWKQLLFFPRPRKYAIPLRKIDVFVVFVSSIADVDETLRNWRTMPKWDRNARVLLMVNALERPKCAVRRMLELFLAYGMQYVYVVYDAPDIFRMAVITWVPVVDSYVSVQTISVCEYGTDVDEDDDGAKLQLYTYRIREDTPKQQCDSASLMQWTVADESITDAANYEAEWIAIK